jgi:uncharacterized protein YeaO (DUF488 family)
MSTTKVQVRRVYEQPQRGDGTRVLVDRIWPRGMTKAKAHLDEWCKQVAPSSELRKWYSHDPDRFDEFTRRYKRELTEPERKDALVHLRKLAQDRKLTLAHRDQATRDQRGGRTRPNARALTAGPALVEGRPIERRNLIPR